MAHCTVQEAEEILDKEFPVLDKGFVRLVDYLGGDERIVQAARVSYGKGTKTYREDRGLISYLLRNRHTSPFEQVIFTFHVKLPIFVARQWIRHRTARLNEISGRYSVMKDEFFLPAPGDIALQSEDNKQGRSEDAVPEGLKEKVLDLLRREQNDVYEGYKELIDDGIARELARVNLPLSTYTEWYWQIDLHNLFHFIELRMDPHAQKEIRVYAEVLFDIMKKVCPLAGEAFEDHLVGAVVFSRKEFEALKKMLAGGGPDSSGLQGKDLERFLRKLETGRQE
jgi:thymidylate synthase (FAD)